MRNRILAVLGILTLVGIVLRVAGFQFTKLSDKIKVAPEPVFCLGGVRESVEHCASGFPVTDSFILSIIVTITLLVIALAATAKIRAMSANGLQNAKSADLVPTGLQNTVEALVEALYNFGQGVDRKNVGRFLPIYATIFFFFLVSNYSGLIPGVSNIGTCVAETHGAETTEAKAPTSFVGSIGACPEGTVLVPFVRSPSTDLNVTFAFSLVTMFIVQYFGFKALGLGYLTKFFNFKQGPIMAFVGIMELISELARILSFAFRLFGNLFAGKTVILVMTFLFPFILPLPFYGLEVFVALIQAVIFAVLALIFMSQAVISHDDHGGHGSGHDKAHH
jgi:F-type H+-transporting ATPase subunit a